jgi:hypothetical protein
VVACGVQPFGGDGEPLSGLLLAASLVLLRVGKNPGLKKNQPSGFFLIFAQKREFLGFFQFSRILLGASRH